LAEGLENWRLTDPPALERARLENGTWRAKVESATALAEFGEAEAAKARFAEARQLAPHEMAVDLAELRVLHTMGDPRASAAGVEAVARFPESDRVRAAAVLVGAVVASPEGTTGK
jgi:thioredoxin-like negative regulator of GroEL